MKLICPDCGEQQYATLDGYFIAERLLEGVIFKITVNPSGSRLVAETAPEAEDYMSGLNKKKWLKEAASYAKKDDVLACPSCEGEVYVEEADAKKKKGCI